MNLDRRAVACVLTFGLITPYMVLPIGFGGIFLNNILLKNLNGNGLNVTASQVPHAMLLPGLGMVVGLLIAVFSVIVNHAATASAKFLLQNQSTKA